MQKEHVYYVYILASAARVLYIGMTSGLPRRIWKHQHKNYPGFTSHFHFRRLVYYEMYDRVDRAIAREKQLKRWRREKKIWLIERANPDWTDLSLDWFKEEPRLGLSTPAAVGGLRSG
ncbi:MAG TPA: GIY-YIG nuclease family protein [Terriglobales bacterium]|nr:GIY-YIG nuclease family protein [Terriglobales bacterium]